MASLGIFFAKNSDSRNLIFMVFLYFLWFFSVFSIFLSVFLLKNMEICGLKNDKYGVLLINFIIINSILSSKNI